MNPLVRSPDEADASTAGFLRQMFGEEIVKTEAKPA
jgi:hypothetical protein